MRKKDSTNKSPQNHFHFQHFLAPLQPAGSRHQRSDAEGTSEGQTRNSAPPTLRALTHTRSVSLPPLLQNSTAATTASSSSSALPSATQQILDRRLAAVSSTNTAVRHLMRKWRHRIQTLEQQQQQRETQLRGASSFSLGLGSSPSIVCDTLLAEISMDVRKTSVRVGGAAVGNGSGGGGLEDDPQLRDFAENTAVVAAASQFYSDNPNNYGPMTRASLEERRKRRAGAEAGAAFSTDEDETTTTAATTNSRGRTSPITHGHGEDVKALAAALLLRYHFGPSSAAVGGGGGGGSAAAVETYFKLLSILTEAAFHEFSAAADPSRNIYSWRHQHEDGGGVEVGNDNALVPRPGAEVAEKVFLRSYREEYTSLITRRRQFVGKPSRVLSSVWERHHWSLVRVVFMAWRGGFRRRMRQLWLGEERADWLFRQKRRAVLRGRFVQWRSHVQSHGKHRRVLHYHGTREKLIQRLARRVGALEGEKRALETDLSAIRENHREVQKDLLAIRRLALGDAADTSQFEALILARRKRVGEQRAAAPAAAAPVAASEGGGDAHAIAPTITAFAEDPAVALRPCTPVEAPSGGGGEDWGKERQEGKDPALRSFTDATAAVSAAVPSRGHALILSDFLRLMEEEEAAVAATPVPALPSVMSGSACPSDDASSTPPSHLQVLDWVSARCKKLGDSIITYERMRAVANEPSTLVASPWEAIVATVSNRPRNFVSDFASGMRLAFVLASVGAAVAVDGEKEEEAAGPIIMSFIRFVHSPASAADRHSILQRSFSQAMLGSEASAAHTIALTGSQCAKALMALFKRFQGTPPVLVPPKRRGTAAAAAAASAASVASSVGSKAKKKAGDTLLKAKIRALKLASSDGNLDSLAHSEQHSSADSDDSSSTLNDSIHSIYEKNFTEEELAAKYHALGECADDGESVRSDTSIADDI